MKTNDGNRNSRLFKFFKEELQDIYWAENALVRAIPNMSGYAASPALKNALDMHLIETKAHVDRLEQVFRIIGTEAESMKCEAMSGIIAEGEEIIDDTEEGAMRDAGIIAAAQKLEHYEIATYGTLRNYAQVLGFAEAVNLLEMTLKEEKAADAKLTEIAVSSINEAAALEMMGD